ncbi:hypothetical protein PI124_g293 [Phytophthora idaei]|nr:hypothetical protein PI124_g293 [Phytophthora idaei]
MPMMNLAVALVLLALAIADGYTIPLSNSSGPNSAATVINITTIVSDSSRGDQGKNSSLLGEALLTELNDFVLTGSISTSDVWLDAVAGYAAAAGNRVLYRTTTWTLLEEGAKYEMVATFWARFRVVNSSASSTSPLLICAMVAEWGAGSSERDAAQAAVEMVDRLQDNCGENDTVALAFTSAATDTVSGYLEGKIAVNDAVALIRL